VSFELPDLGAVGIHRVLLDVARLVDLVDDDLGVVVGYKPLNPQGYSDAQPVNQGLILSTIVGCLVVDLQDVLQVIALGGDEEYACPTPSGFREPSKYIFQCSGFSAGGGCWVSVH
jgi:hypothetical protein